MFLYTISSIFSIMFLSSRFFIPLSFSSQLNPHWISSFLASVSYYPSFISSFSLPKS